MQSDFKNILIIKPSSLGDIVLALPALCALRRGFPDARISWLVRPEFAPLLEGHCCSVETILFNRKFLGKAWYNRRAFASLLSLVRRLRRSRFDAVIDLQGLFRTASLGWLSGCKRRFGMATAREFASVFYTEKVAQDHDSIHLVDYYLKIVSYLVSREVYLEPRFALQASRDAVDSVGRLLTSCGISAGNYVVFVPGSAHGDKCWPVERFAALADKISSQFGLPIVAVGTESEKGIVEKIKDLTEVPIANFAGVTSLAELIALLKAARLVVSNDTGPGHIAAALGVPLAMMFSWSNPARIAPYGRSECMVAAEPYSRPAGIKSSDPKYDIKAITVEQVYKKVCEQVNS